MKLNKELQRHMDRIKNDPEMSPEGIETEQYIVNCVQELLDVTYKQGHSGTSFYYMLNMFTKVAKREPLAPLTGEDDEWMEVGRGGLDGITEQNKILSSVFRINKDNSTAYDVDGRVFISPDGHSFVTGRPIDGVSGFLPVTFPYLPKKEYYYVDETETKILKREIRA